MTYRVVLNRLVEDDVDHIAEWFLNHAGPEAADRKVEELAAFLEMLAEMPHRGTVRSGYAEPVRAVPVDHKTTVVFSVDEGKREVHVHAIAYAGRNWMRRVTR
ncbi:type II toxin-antitoxin system RelE/ParE family toxin [Caenispirillum salinarum]|uniref:type II toxin-antitoxin system RelE/ParE family toxin n=1 Tax=Caenispirillum salinarum TaxID=859058 RepID=UPI00384A9F6B